MLNKLLVAIDESASSNWAFETALELAGALNAELILVHALDIFASSSPVSPFTLVDGSSSELDEKAQKNYELKITEYASRYDALLKEKQAEAQAAGVTTQSIQPYGRPGPTICRAASDHNVDLIVVGNRDRSTLKELVPGSVSNYVVHHAPCSVTIIHSDNQSQPMALAQSSEFSLAGMV